MELVLHIGAHRTGTTALQQILRRARPRLARRGVEFWGPQEMRAPDIASYARRRAEARTPEHRIALASTRGEVAAAVAAAEAAGRRRLVVSEENLLGSMERNLLDASLYPTARQKLAAMAELFPMRPATVCLCLRDYAGYWPSAHSHVLLHRDMPPFDAARLHAATRVRGWVEVVADVAAALPGARIVLWRHGRTQDHLRRALSALVGAGMAGKLALPDAPANASLPMPALEEIVARRARSGGLSPEERRAAVAELRPLGGPPFRPFGPEAEADLSRRFEDDWARLAAGAVPGVDILPDSAERADP